MELYSLYDAHGALRCNAVPYQAVTECIERDHLTYSDCRIVRLSSCAVLRKALEDVNESIIQRINQADPALVDNYDELAAVSMTLCMVMRWCAQAETGEASFQLSEGLKLILEGK